MIDSMTISTHATPLRSKNQYQLMVQELLTFCQLMGHVAIILKCDKTGFGSAALDDGQCKVVHGSCYTSFNTQHPWHTHIQTALLKVQLVELVRWLGA